MKYEKSFLGVLSSIFIFALAVMPAYAFDDFSISHATVIRVPSAIYVCFEIFSVILIVLHCFSRGKKDRWLLIFLISVLIVNCGYYCVAISKSLFEALFSDIFVRFGSVMVSFSMLIIITDICRFKIKRVHKIVLLCLSLVLFIVTSSGFYSNLYYKDVSIVIDNGSARLVKNFGPLYVLYLVYFLFLFGAMLVIIYCSVKRRIYSHRYDVLAVLVLINIVTWLIDNFVPVKFNFLSVSYILTCFTLYRFNGALREKESELSLTEEKKELNSEIAEEDFVQKIIPEEEKNSCFKNSR